MTDGQRTKHYDNSSLELNILYYRHYCLGTNTSKQNYTKKNYHRSSRENGRDRYLTQEEIDI